MRAWLLILVPAVMTAAGGTAQSPDEVLLSANETGPGWSVVREAPADPSSDPDLRAWGVRGKEARHYTRDRAGSIQVCSVEVWTFIAEANARAAHGGFSYPEWRIDREGAVLVMVHGMVTTRGQPPRRGVFPACGDLAARIRSRARPGSR